MIYNYLYCYFDLLIMLITFLTKVSCFTIFNDIFAPRL